MSVFRKYSSSSHPLSNINTGEGCPDGMHRGRVCLLVHIAISARQLWEC